MAWWNKGQHTHHGVFERNYLETKRRFWGCWPELGRQRQKTEGLRDLVRSHERDALAMLPHLGFTEVDNWCGHSNQFLVDAVATYHGERVLVDVTSRLRHHVPEKLALARSLRMHLYILFLSPDRSLHYLAGPVENKSVRIPMGFFRARPTRAAYEGVSP